MHTDKVRMPAAVCTLQNVTLQFSDDWGQLRVQWTWGWGPEGAAKDGTWG